MKKTNSFVCGITSIVMAAISFFIFGFLSISGLILSICGLVAYKKEKAEGNTNTSSLVLNIVGVVFSAIMFVLYVRALSVIA